MLQLSRLISLVCMSATAWTVLAHSSLLAQPRIKVGFAEEAQNQVDGILGSSTEPIAQGSDLFHEELIRTGSSSKANLRFLDDTRLNIGELSDVKLDRFVYDPDKKTGAFILNLNRGLLRFSTGTMVSASYRLNTPIAWVGVRGTLFDAYLRIDRLTLYLLNGALQAGLPDGRVFAMNTPNTALTIFLDGRIDGPRPWTGSVLEFAALPPPAAPPGTPPNQQTKGEEQSQPANSKAAVQDGRDRSGVRNADDAAKEPGRAQQVISNDKAQGNSSTSSNRNQNSQDNFRSERRMMRSFDSPRDRPR